MPLAEVPWADVITALGALTTAVGGTIAAYSALVRAKHEGTEECQEKLKGAREEAETTAAELHKLRMQQ
jgi:hypothetical protein